MLDETEMVRHANGYDDPTGPREPGRALVRFERRRAERSESLFKKPVGEPPLAGFVTQLIACRSRIGPYRRHRRDEPDVALASYRGRALDDRHAFDLMV